MPGNVHYFLIKYLNWLRWYDEDLMEWIDEGSAFDLKKYDMDFGAYHRLLKNANYEHLFAQNMAIVIAVLLLIIFIWLLILAKDLISYLMTRFGKNQNCSKNLRSKEQMKNKSRWCQNFVLRFVYEFFLEFCICIFLQLSVLDFSELSPSLQFCLSVAIAIALIALIIFVISLCFFNGPWISNYYLKGT